MSNLAIIIYKYDNSLSMFRVIDYWCVERAVDAERIAQFYK